MTSCLVSRQRAQQFNGVYLKKLTDNFFQIFFIATSWVALSIKNIKTRASREMISRKIIKISIVMGLKSLDSIPPTQHALFQHAKRALLAALWRQSLSKIPKIPKPSDWGWEWNTRTNQWVPFWTYLADVSHACSWPAGVIVSAIELDSDAAHSANVKGAAQTMTTRPSEMANTSPCHIPVLGDVPLCVNI